VGGNTLPAVLPHILTATLSDNSVGIAIPRRGARCRGAVRAS